jgi:putative membrane protein insertion efficiency factor
MNLQFIKRFLTTLFLLPVYFYRVCISPLTPASCRFTPTCSEYAIQSVKKYGPLKGSFLTVKRLLRCHPWGGSGYDPVA